MELATTLSTITPAHVLEDLKEEIVKLVRSIASAGDRSNLVSVCQLVIFLIQISRNVKAHRAWMQVCLFV